MVAEKVQKVSLTNEQAEAFGAALLKSLIAMNDAGEWRSLSFNLTSGPNEAPIVLLAFAPGTTKEHAIVMQNKFAMSVPELNAGS